jgi:type IV pilus assembly protein PilN
MVRVNLLPDRKQSKVRGGGGGMTGAEPGQLWILAVLGVVVLELIVCIFIQKLKTDQLNAVVGENAKISAQIDSIKKQISNHADIKAQLKALRDREEAINKLESARTGPTTVMLELSRILTPGKGPTTDRDKLEQLKRDNPTAVLNPNWDPKRVWLQSYQELERTVKLGGLARDPEDVSELERRLILSDYFYAVNLLPGSKVIDDRTKQEVVKFEMTAKVRY